MRDFGIDICGAILSGTVRVATCQQTESFSLL
jgi:hypothetical protein